ncbi:MAG: glycosyltransferase family 4 protein [Acidobacteria bacterium]|nr:glycosyltransferase family 4 protein [Acidobacteriota bacterium]MBW4046221.1 glycosyltransferase family 4 protein [Acidobacteriota bacterium]
MHILLVANYAPDRQQSMLRYEDLLARELPQRGHQVSEISPPSIFGRLAPADTTLGKWLGYIDKFLLFPPLLRLRARRVDVVHICDHSNSMYLPHSPRKPWVITCHDLLAVRSALGHFEGIVTSRTGKLLQSWILAGLKRSRHTICVSHKTHVDWNAIIGTPAAVIHNPMNWHFAPTSQAAIRAVRQKHQIGDGEYVLSVGGDNWYKDRPALIRIFAAMRRLPQYGGLRLVLAGRPPAAELRALIASESLTDAVVEIHDCSNNDLMALYTGALALLFPSREEGFGWPILEAQACGCAVVTTAREPMREVSGDAAILIDAAQPEAAAEHIAQQLSQATQLRQRGFENLTRFDLDTILSRYIDYYNQVRQSL